MTNEPKPEPIDRHDAAKRFYDLLGGGTRELRGISTKGVVVGYFDNADDFAHAVREANEKGYNVYTNLNPLDARFQPAAVHRGGEACTDADIVRLWFILVDCDPERDHPKGGKICSTDAEHEAARKKIQAVKQFLIDEGCPPEAIVENDSGNGGALLVRIDLPNVPDSVSLVRRFLQALRRSSTMPAATSTRRSAIRAASRGPPDRRTRSYRRRSGPTGSVTRSVPRRSWKSPRSKC